ncbi:hypothetical protein SKAU_G00391470 [Synaphobranchus kaupii]|uniref:Uncharacterized protein n=1 Tax=Synaphobranchus kaupii TaxID=118154 RepID=A0A9Q1ICU1_SYNKA|nr:hypothetical protein SKAU_G00391470 [Synaphobranchus kaupii]
MKTQSRTTSNRSAENACSHRRHCPNGCHRILCQTTAEDVTFPRALASAFEPKRTAAEFRARKGAREVNASSRSDTEPETTEGIEVLLSSTSGAGVIQTRRSDAVPSRFTCLTHECPPSVPVPPVPLPVLFGESHKGRCPVTSSDGLVARFTWARSLLSEPLLLSKRWPMIAVKNHCDRTVHCAQLLFFEHGLK